MENDFIFYSTDKENRWHLIGAEIKDFQNIYMCKILSGKLRM